MSDRVIASVSFLEQVADHFGGDLSVAKCFLNSYSYYFDTYPAEVPEDAVIAYLRRALPSKSHY